jgi:hypothetical protein
MILFVCNQEHSSYEELKTLRARFDLSSSDSELTVVFAKDCNEALGKDSSYHQWFVQ